MAKTMTINNGSDILTIDCETGLIVRADNLPSWYRETTEEYKDKLSASMDFRNPVRSPYVPPKGARQPVAENVIPW